MLRGDLDKYWKRFDALTEDNMRKAIKSPDVIRSLRLFIKKKSTINFTDAEVAKAIDKLIS